MRFGLFMCGMAVIFGSGAGPEAKGLYRLNADGTGLKLVVGVDKGAPTSPQQSPDGKLIAFDKTDVHNEQNQPTLEFDHIFVVPSEGGEAKDFGPGMLPSWSPDSKQICFTVAPGAKEAEPGLYVMNADGSGRQWLFNAYAARWSPDGGRIAYFVDDTLWVYDILAGAKMQLTARSQWMTGTPAWSPDGKKIAFIYRGDADHTISIVDTDKEMQEPRVLWEGHGISRSPSWAPNEKILVFANPEGTNDIYVLDTAKKQPPARPFEGKLNFHPKDVSWAADGAGIVFIKPN